MGTKNGLGHSVTAQFIKIVQSALGTGKQNDICFQKIVCIVGVVKVDPLIAFQHIEIRKVRQMTEQHDGNIDLALYGRTLFLYQFQ